MAELPGQFPRLVFHSRAKSVPGDLRISWRLSMTLLVFRYSRGRRASFAKLHILNDALRSDSARERLVALLDGELDFGLCTIRIEPAFSRGLDLMIGKGLVEWLVASGRLSVKLTPLGAEMASAIDSEHGLLIDERCFLDSDGRRVTEQVVQRIVAGRRGLL